jgi:uncharacterized repeat protein (TIGR03803 family)
MVSKRKREGNKKSRHSRGEISSFACCGLILATLLPVGAAHAGGFSILYSFQGGWDGSRPDGTLIADSTGNLYGTTYAGGLNRCHDTDYRCGTVFRIDKNGREKVIYRFTGGLNGIEPVGGVILDSSNNLYGTTSGGPHGQGTNGNVFEIAADGSEKTLTSFPDLGGNPSDSLLLLNGVLYGTTQSGGDGENCTQGCGVLFKLTTAGTETVLHQFGNGNDGEYPMANVISDASGNLYGTTFAGGAIGAGTVFKLTANGKESVLYSFAGGTDGIFPYGGLVADPSGDLYGTTAIGGGTGCDAQEGCGIVFKIAPNGSETVLYRFAGGSDGGNPYAGLIRDNAGNLYGTTGAGGGNGCQFGDGCGTVFEITAAGVEKILYAFSGGSDGANPYGGLLMKKNVLYGTTTVGGSTGNGVVFKIDK